MSKMQRARELYKLHNGSRPDVIHALVCEEGMSNAGASTFFHVLRSEEAKENYRRRHQWDFLKDPYTYFLVLLALIVAFGR
ncbi:hypothetical protein D3C75_224010 [compost metagenome]